MTGWAVCRWVKPGMMLAACSPEYSPNTYSSNAVQQANKVEPGIIVGFREVAISTTGTVGAVTGGAAGGVLGSQAGVTPLQNALGGVTGTAVGALVGTAVEHATTDTTGWEYIVRKHNGDLLSVTQKEEKPLSLGQKVLVITGAQARVIADYSVDPLGETKNEHKEEPAKAEAKPPPSPLAPIIIIATPNGLPAQVTVPSPDGGAPTIIPLPSNLGAALPTGVPAIGTAAPLVKLVTPEQPSAPDATESSGTEPVKAEAAAERPLPKETTATNSTQSPAPSEPAPAPIPETSVEPKTSAP